jgi:signal transduction histidine kinase
LYGAWDAARLERAIANLVGNAVKYSPSGGEILVPVRREQAVDGDYAVVTVRDSGIGIPEADPPHIFRRFYRGNNVVGRFGGAGLGLGGARHIIERHGGTIAVDSREGCGTMFTVRLPVDVCVGPDEQ